MHVFNMKKTQIAPGTAKMCARCANHNGKTCTAADSVLTFQGNTEISVTLCNRANLKEEE